MYCQASWAVSLQLSCSFHMFACHCQISVPYKQILLNLFSTLPFYGHNRFLYLMKLCFWDLGWFLCLLNESMKRGILNKEAWASKKFSSDFRNRLTLVILRTRFSLVVRKKIATWLYSNTLQGRGKENRRWNHTSMLWCQCNIYKLEIKKYYVVCWYCLLTALSKIIKHRQRKWSSYWE